MSHPRRPSGAPGASIRARSLRPGVFPSRPGRRRRRAELRHHTRTSQPCRMRHRGCPPPSRRPPARKREPNDVGCRLYGGHGSPLARDHGEWAGADGCALARMTTDVRFARIRGERGEMRREREVRRHHRPPAPPRQPEKTKAPLPAPCEELAEWTGLEPATSGVTGQHSNRLNYHSALESKLYCPLAVLSTLSCRRPVRTGGC